MSVTLEGPKIKFYPQNNSIETQSKPTTGITRTVLNILKFIFCSDSWSQHAWAKISNPNNALAKNPVSLSSSGSFIDSPLTTDLTGRVDVGFRYIKVKGEVGNHKDGDLYVKQMTRKVLPEKEVYRPEWRSQGLSIERGCYDFIQVGACNPKEFTERPCDFNKNRELFNKQGYWNFGKT